MTAIEVEVPDQLADHVDDVRRALANLFARAAQRAEVVEAPAGDGGLLAESESPPAGASIASSYELVGLLNALTLAPGSLADVRAMLENLAVRQGVIRHVTDTVANLPLPVGAATARQIALLDQSWRAIKARYGALDAGQYAELTGASPTSRSMASKATSKGLVGYRRGRRVLYPGFQFDERGLRDGWEDIVAPLRGAAWDDDDIVLWLAAPHGGLGRRSPVEALDDGDRDLVLDVVRDATAGVR